MPEVSSMSADKNKCVLALADCCEFTDPHHTKSLPLKVQLHCGVKLVLKVLYIYIENLCNHLCKKTVTKAMSIRLLDIIVWNITFLTENTHLHPRIMIQNRSYILWLLLSPKQSHWQKDPLTIMTKIYISLFLLITKSELVDIACIVTVFPRQSPKASPKYEER